MSTPAATTTRRTFKVVMCCDEALHLQEAGAGVLHWELEQKQKPWILNEAQKGLRLLMFKGWTALASKQRAVWWNESRTTETTGSLQAVSCCHCLYWLAYESVCLGSASDGFLSQNKLLSKVKFYRFCYWTEQPSCFRWCKQEVLCFHGDPTGAVGHCPLPCIALHFGGCNVWGNLFSAS